jgi:hypothetical protein
MSSGGSSSEDDMIYTATPTKWHAVEESGRVTRLRGPKIDRSDDARTPWARTDWQGHVDAKLRTGEWYEYYHMPLVTFNKLHDLLFTETPEEHARSKQQGDNSTKMGAIDTHVKLACTLRELYGEKRKSIVDVFKISKTSARLSFLNVLSRINACPELHGQLFDTDHSNDVLELRAFAFQQRSAYPTIFRHVVGAIDGLLIKTQQPTAKEVGNVRSYYSGHKKLFGVNMQGVCDASCRFIAFSCNTAGSTSDYVAFKHSNCYGTWPQVPSPFYYVGDCAYPLAPYCIIPYVGTSLPPHEDVFNFYHSQLRITIERAFGIFVNVFRIFHTPLAFSISCTCDVVEACVKLHNYRINENCQHVARSSSNNAIYRQHSERSNDVFDVLDDERYVTVRPHASDAVYARHVAAEEAHSGLHPCDAALGVQRRSVVAIALQHAGALRPAANVRKE